MACAVNAVIYRESVYIGETDLTQEEVHQLILKMGQDYKGNRYHLLQRSVQARCVCVWGGGGGAGGR